MRRKHNKNEIIDLGKTVFRTNGLNKTGVNMIIEKAELPKGSFYNFFESKEDYARQVLNSYVSDQYAFASKILDDNEKGPLERIESFYRTMIDINGAENCENGCLLANMTMEMGGHSDDFSHDMDYHFAGITEILAKCVAAGQNQGEITDKYEALCYRLANKPMPPTLQASQDFKADD